MRVCAHAETVQRVPKAGHSDDDPCVRENLPVLRLNETGWNECAEESWRPGRLRKRQERVKIQETAREGTSAMKKRRQSEARKEQDPLQQREEPHSCFRERRTSVTRAAQEERQSDARDWKRGRLQDSTRIKKSRINNHPRVRMMVQECSQQLFEW